MPITYRQGPPTHPGLWLFEYPINTDFRGSLVTPYVDDDNTPAECRIHVRQTNVSISDPNVIRGVHAEPWNKHIFIAYGAVFAAIVNLRDEESFGQVFTTVLKPGSGIFLPKGFGNSFLAVEPTVYVYDVDDIWQPDVKYPSVDPFDHELAIPWPIARKDVIISDKDMGNPSLAQVRTAFVFEQGLLK
jgi:dTDP-4-dehydrorhamnose 3,5-epimerase